MSRYGSYSGSTTFEYDVERFKDRETGELLVEDDLKYPDTDDSFEFEMVRINLTVTGNAYYHPGRYSGPPEDCEPDDSDEEIESVTDESGKDWESLLTKSERDDILDKIIENVSSHDGYDPPDDYDDFDDPRADYVYDPFN